MTAQGPLVIARTDGVETWTLNLPETRNPISGTEMIEALVAALDRVGDDPLVHAVVLTGAGPAFSAGGDIKAMTDRSGVFGDPPPQQRIGYDQGIQQIPRAFAACEVPVVAAVNGPAVGAGCDLALMCDIRVASHDAVFAESFVRLGLVPGDGGAYLLTQVIGAARAAQLTLTGSPIDAPTALDWGLVSEVVEPDRLLPAAHEIAARIAANPPPAVRMAKRLLREAQRGTLESVLTLSAAMQAVAHTTPEHHAALDALRSRRKDR